jgi:hypothetical protein
MCVIVICTDVKPNFDTVMQCHRENPDGFGIAWVQDEKVRYKKGIVTPRDAYDEIQEIELPFVCHFRKASIGGYSRVLHHPFEISEESNLDFEGECDRLLFHNGTFPFWRVMLTAAQITIPEEIVNGKSVEEPMSDSRAIAMTIAKLNQKSKDCSILRQIGGHFVVLDAKDNKIWMYGDFLEEKGISFSNLKWKTYSYYGSSGYSSGYSYNGQSTHEQKKANIFGTILQRFPEEYYLLSRKDKRKYREKLRIEKIKAQIKESQEAFDREVQIQKEIEEAQSRAPKIHQVVPGAPEERDFNFLCEC